MNSSITEILFKQFPITYSCAHHCNCTNNVRNALFHLYKAAILYAYATKAEDRIFGIHNFVDEILSLLDNLLSRLPKVALVWHWHELLIFTSDGLNFFRPFIQIFALLLRPKQDHKYRFYWNIYHHGVGYAILVLGIINVFKGLDILDPSKKWKTIYTVVIAALGVIAFLLEAIAWVIVLKKKSNKSTKPYDGSNNGDGRQQPLAPWSTR